MDNYSLDTQRQNYLQNIVAPKLNCDFYSNLYSVNEFFHLSDELNLPENLCSIVGSFDGFSYCYCEYIKVQKVEKFNEVRDVEKKQAFCSILLDDNLPDFDILKKDEFQKENSELIIKNSDFFIELIIIFMSFAFIVLFSKYSIDCFNKASDLYVFNIFIIISSIMAFAFSLISIIIKTNRRIICIEDYSLPYDFNEKYKIICDKSLKKSVNNFFTYDLCKKILSIQGNFNKIRCRNGFLQLELNGEEINSDNCIDIIKYIIIIAQIFKDNLLDLTKN